MSNSPPDDPIPWKPAAARDGDTLSNPQTDESVANDDSGGPPAYCNWINVVYSGWDFLFDFGQQAPLRNAEGQVVGATVYRIGRLAMSPQHAKAVLGILQKNVADFEKQFGAISLPEGVAE